MQFADEVLALSSKCSIAHTYLDMHLMHFPSCFCWLVCQGVITPSWLPCNLNADIHLRKPPMQSLLDVTGPSADRSVASLLLVCLLQHDSESAIAVVRLVVFSLQLSHIQAMPCYFLV